jgi:hypothetical protein
MKETILTLRDLIFIPFSFSPRIIGIEPKISMIIKSAMNVLVIWIISKFIVSGL